jgi:hypothetical protein
LPARLHGRRAPVDKAPFKERAVAPNTGPMTLRPLPLSPLASGVVAVLAALAVLLPASVARADFITLSPPSPLGTVPHVGPRHVEVVVDQKRSVFAPSSFWNAALPAGVLLDGASNPAVANDLAGQAARVDPYVNTTSWSAELVVVAPDQPLVPVTLTRTGSSALTAVFKTGLPIPPGWRPQGDRDAHAVFYQPDYVGPGGHRGRYYEAWRIAQDATTGQWSADWGGRITSVETSNGYFTDWRYSGYRYSTPGDPDSTYQEKGWGGTATSLPLIGGVISAEDCALGTIEHAVGLAVINPKAGYRWPAQRGDGWSGSTSVIQEGMRLRFPPGYEPPATLHPFARMLSIAVRDYGAVVWDKAGTVSVRAEPPCTSLFDGTTAYDLLNGFEWGKLEVLATGSASNPNPSAG